MKFLLISKAATVGTLYLADEKRPCSEKDLLPRALPSFLHDRPACRFSIEGFLSAGGPAPADEEDAERAASEERRPLHTCKERGEYALLGPSPDDYRDADLTRESCGQAWKPILSRAVV